MTYDEIIEGWLAGLGFKMGISKSVAIAAECKVEDD